MTLSGKFLRCGDERFLIRGVSYGTFAPNLDGNFPDPQRIARDFQAIAEVHANTVRTYTVPPQSLLDEAARSGLRVIVGIPWSQHIAFLDRRADVVAIRRTVSDHVKRLASHPAAMLFAVGNEIPPSVVRWYGRARIEGFLHELYDEAKSAAPDALLTYVNYPPTEYLETPFFDVCAFNVFLHSPQELSAYLARLHHIAGPRPLLISEAGADSLRNGADGQAALVRMQLETAFQEGACGAVVFTWTDEWWRGGQPVDDWAFGIVDAERRPKAVYRDVQEVFHSAPFQHLTETPRVSVVVCAYNAVDTIDECLTALERLNYPDFEVIVVNDGSVDGTEIVAGRHPFARLINTPNAGLAAARNVGLAHATGSIVAYTDADVRVDSEWLAYLVQPFRDAAVAGAGGPAVVPDDDPWRAQCVARAPGAPTHVLLDDRIAEHVPGCNCAFRRDVLEAIGGFNPIFVRAGDDVDVCWRVQAEGWQIAFAPAALVWHRHRSSARAYWRQQVGYGEGEAWLAREHPRKFVRGRITWHGHIYSPLPFIQSLRTSRINAGPFGSAGFPSVYRTDAHPFAYLPHSGRWQVAWTLFLLGAALAWMTGAWVAPPLLAAGIGTLLATLAKCVIYGLHSDVERLPRIGGHRRRASTLIYRATIAWLHFIQPFARLRGRLRGLTHPPAHAAPEPAREAAGVAGARPADFVQVLRLCLSRPMQRSYWSEQWIDLADLLRSAADRLRQQRAVRHIELDSGWWEDRDLTVVDRSWFRIDVRALLEDHGGGRCLHRLAIRLRPTPAAAFPLLLGVAAGTALRYAGLSWRASIASVGIVVMLLVIARVMAASRVVLDAVENAATEFGMLSMTSEPRRTLTPTPAPTRESRGILTAATRIADPAGAARAPVGDA